MAQQTLQTIIAIGGRIDNSFGMLGTQLTLLGSQIDAISQKLLDFGKESLDVYVNYDDLMREVKAVGEFTDAEIKSLDKINSQIAKTTVYSNLQAAEAEVIMGQYGMTVEEIRTLLPDVLELAMAGNLSIADSVDYLYSSLKSLGEGFDYANVFTDQMAKTAAIGATDIDTLGESYERVGSAAKMFKGGSAEIFAILSAMSQFGEDQRGSEGGTWIRNFALGLVATDSDIATLRATAVSLGLEQDAIDELDELIGKRRTGLSTVSLKMLEAAGLQRYDAEGNLLPMIDIIKSLRDTVMGSDEWAGDLTELTGALEQAGGDLEAFTVKAEGLPDNQLFVILRQIFSRRGLTTALNLLSISDEEWTEITGDILNSEGFAESMAETMQGGLGGVQRKLDAVYTEFKSSVGEELEPWATDVTGFLTDVVNTLDDIDPSGMQALTSALIPLAVAGPALVGAGTFFRLVGYALGPAGGVVVGALALTSAVMALNSLRESDIKASFGDMDLDMESLSAYVTELGSAFSKSYEEVNEFSTALDGAVTAYGTASTAFAGSLLTDMLTGKTLTDEDKAALLSFGQEMGDQLNAGILSSAQASMTNIARLFGGEELAKGDESYQILIGALEDSKAEMLANAAEVSQGLRDELLSAFEDGEISEDEYLKIKSWFDAYNAAIAQIAREAQSEQDAIALQILLHKGQTGSLEDAQEYGNKVLAARDEALTTLEDDYLHDYYKAKIALDKQVADGEITRQQAETALAELERNYQADVTAKSAPYADAYQRLWDTVLTESDLGAAYADLQTLAEGVMQGAYSMEAAGALFEQKYGRGWLWAPGDADQLATVIAEMQESAGGQDAALLDPILQKYALMQAIASQANTDAENIYGAIGDALATGYTAEAAREAISELGINQAWENVGTIIAGNYGIQLSSILSNLEPEMQAEFYRIVDRLGETYDLAAVLARMPEGTPGGSEGRVYAAFQLMFGDVRKDADQYLLEQEPLELPVEQPDLAPIGGFLSEAQRMLDENPGSWVITVTRHYTSVFDTFGGSAGSGKSGSGLGIGAGASGRASLFAEGGRADEPSIFGEDGAEWAVPEEHSARTAELLNAAREASGFTWPELIDRTGGLNADAGHAPAQLIYSPTIIVKDARGVKEALEEDKERLEKWYREKRLKDDIEVYS